MIINIMMKIKREMKNYSVKAGLLFLLLMAVAGKVFAGDFKIMEGISDSRLRAIMESNVNAMISAFNTSSSQGRKLEGLSKDNFTGEVIKELQAMWKTSGMTIPDVNISARCMNTLSGYQVRGIPVDVTEADSADQRQELSIDFTRDGKISNVAIALEMHRYDQIMAEQTSDMDYKRRQVVINFIDNFRTAYNRKDLKLLRSVYSDKALIITGKVVSEKPKSDIDRLTLTNGKVVYISQSKQEYLQNLERVFKTTKFVDVKFEDIEVIQHGKYDDVYGVTLKQYWHTDRYKDEGYLFLLIDFHDKDYPLITVRAWQPYKNKQGQVVTSEKDRYNIGSFNVEKKD